MKKNHLSLLMRLISFSAIVIMACVISSVRAQLPDSKGKDFWITFPGIELFEGSPYVYIAANQPTTGSVTVPGLGFSSAFTASPGAITTIKLPPFNLGNSSDSVTNLGVHIVASGDITLYGYTGIGSVYLAIPTDALGTEYINLGYRNTMFNNRPLINGTQFAIAATQNATNITITPTLTVKNHPAGVPYNITLNMGQTYQLKSDDITVYIDLDKQDLSGTIISSNKPIAVFGGHSAALVPTSSISAGAIIQELPPVTSWGKTFYTVPFKNFSAGDIFRIMASANGTGVKINGASVSTLDRGQYFEITLRDPSAIVSNKPVLIMQYRKDSSNAFLTAPFMMLVPPHEQYLINYSFATVPSELNSKGIIFSNYINLVANNASIGELTLDGAVISTSSFKSIAGTNFSSAQLDLSYGVHTIGGSNLPSAVNVYGQNSIWQTFGYVGAQSFANITAVSGLALSPKTGSGYTNTSLCEEALLRDQFNKPVVGTRVDFTIQGANKASSGYAITDANGIARYCYIGRNAGIDTIKATAGTYSDVSTFLWTIVQHYYSKSVGNLQDVSTWGFNQDGTGQSPPGFIADKTYHLANRGNIYSLNADWTVLGNVDIPAGSIFQLNGFTLTIGGMTGDGLLKGSITSNLHVAGPSAGDAGTLKFASTGALLNSLEVTRSGASSHIAIGTPLDIYDVLSVSNGWLHTGDHLTLKSSALRTARVAPVINGNIYGNVTVERFIPARRAWRIVSAPVDRQQYINQAWQEGATTYSANPNPHPGYGTFITGGDSSQGFDRNPLSALPSIKIYNSGADRWVPVTSTVSYPFQVSLDAYMLFVRGDRSVALGGNTIPANNTTLRATGNLRTGTQFFRTAKKGFTAILNPFASPINFATISRSNVANNFYVWDPKLGGDQGVGGYVLLSFNGSGYDVIPAAASQESQYIQSGQGFLVHSITNDYGVIAIKESDKIAASEMNVFRNNTKTQGLRINLQAISTSDSSSVIDEVFTSYNNSAVARLDVHNGLKLSNIEENIAIDSHGDLLMLERKKLPQNNDTIRLKVWNISPNKKYQLEIIPVNLANTGLYTVLFDNNRYTSLRLSVKEKTRIALIQDAADTAHQFMIIVSKDKNEISTLTPAGIIKCYPNPVENRQVTVQFINKPLGTYTIEIINPAGVTIYKRQLQNIIGSFTQPIQLTTKPSAGLYILRVTGAGKETELPVVIK